MTAPLPYTIIGGYLGAGKTTLLNNLLRHSGGLRLAIMVNDFGDINIDADLITSHDGETLNLANGCICCSLADGFLAALGGLRDRAGQIDHVVIEASGVSDPVKISQYGTMLGYDLDGVIVLADAEQVRERAVNKYVGETVIRQLQGADLIVLNKMDLVNAEEAADVRDWLHQIAPQAQCMETSYGQLPLAVLLGRLPATARPDTDPGAAAAHEGTHGTAYETWSFTSGEALPEIAVRALAQQLPDSILRAKGFVYLLDDPGQRYLLQRVGRRWTLEAAGPWGEPEPQTRLVFIGLPGSSSAAALTAALRDHEPPSPAG